MRNEYVNLLNFYQIEIESKSKLEAELIKETETRSKLEAELGHAYQKLNLKAETQSQSKKLKAENCELQTNFKNKCLEINHLKSEIDTLKKDKNVLSVALKGSKKEIIEKATAFKKEKEILEKKNEDLNEYRSKKLNEEREEKNRKKKELKKEKKKNIKTPVNATSKDDENYETKENTESEQTLLKTDEIKAEDKSEQKAADKEDATEDATTNHAMEDLNIIESDGNGNLCKKTTIETIAARESEREPGTNNNLDSRTDDEALTESDDTRENIENNNDEVVNENDPEFIGPKHSP